MQAGSGVGAFQSALEAMAIEAGRAGEDKEPQTQNALIEQLRQLETQYPD